MGRFWFVRHGESVANAEGWLAGHYDAALTPRGVAQARALWAPLSSLRPRRVWSSDLRRAWETAALAWGEGPPAVQRTTGLRERTLGRWERHTTTDLKASGGMGRLLTWDGAPPGGESQRMLSERVLTWLDAHDGGQDTLIFAHGGLIRCVVGLLDNTPREHIGTWKVDNAQVVQRDVRAGTWGRLLAFVRGG